MQDPRSGVRDDRPSIVIGITHPQTCLVLNTRLRAFRAAGFRVTLICSPGPMLDRLAADEGIEPLAFSIKRGIDPLADIVSLFRLWRALRRLRPDLTEFSTPKAGLLGNLAARLCGVPGRVYFLRGLRLETAAGLKWRVLLAAEQIASGCAQYVVCNSESLRNQALRLGIAPAGKLRMIGDGSSNGVNVERFSPGPTDIRSKLGLPQVSPVVGFVGRLTRDKGVPELVEAFDAILKAVPTAWLLLVGWFDDSDDAISQELRARIDRHPRMIRTGFVADPAPYYRAMNVMVLPTWREGFPNVVLEAAASGIPVVTTFSTGSRDAVVPEVTGLLVPPGYPEAISEAVVQLLRDPDRRHRMGRAARLWVIEHFVNARVLGLTVAFYKGILRARPVVEIDALAKDAPLVD